MPTYSQLKGISRISDSLASDQLEANLSQFISWGLLGAGGFFNVRIPTSGVWGGDFSQMRLADDPNYLAGQVWEGARKDWVWESGVECPDGQPIRVSGAFVDGGFVPVGTGLAVDHPNGRLVFAEPRPASGVRCEHSYRLVQTYTADCDWWQQVQTDSFRVDDAQFLQRGSGAWDVLGQSRVQLPALIVEAVPNARKTGFEMGSGGHRTRQDVLFHVLAEERWHLKWLHDALTYQKDKTIYGFDKNLLLAADAYPLDPYGSPRASGLMYPDLVKASGDGGFRWQSVIVQETRAQEQPRVGAMRYCTVRLTCEFDTP
jgi:hypothetical protein